MDENSETEKRLLRQRERVTDNIKWLIAYVFAFSFATAGNNVIKALTPFFQGDRIVASYHLWWLNLEILLAFSITASVFYYQGVRSLDLRFAMDPQYEPHPLSFILDFGTIAVTMVPFVLMAHSLAPEITSVTGFTLFFFSYILLLMLGLALLVVADVRHTSWWKRIFVDEKSKEGSAEPLRRYWMIMNSAIVILLGSLYYMFSRNGGCPTQVTDSFPIFILIFGLIAIARDIVDFFWAWAFMFPSGRTESIRKKWPLEWIDQHPVRARWMGYGMLLVLVVVAFGNHWFSVFTWTHACPTITVHPSGNVCYMCNPMLREILSAPSR